MPYTLNPDMIMNPLEKFLPGAMQVCNEIVDFQPDLVISLMHTGWLPTYASMELWKKTQALDFPPLVCANVGLEKMERFNALENRPRVNGSFVGHFEEDDGQAFFLAWLYDQMHWQEELRELIREQIGDRVPKRILVIDEFISEGSTCMLTLGLLDIIFPRAIVHFYNANLEYKKTIFHEWLRLKHPEFLESDLTSRDPEFHTLVCLAENMVLGTEDVDPESLRWRTVRPSSACFEKLSMYLSIPEWLELPEFSRQLVQNEITQHILGPITRTISRGRSPQLRPGILIMREIYRHGPLTLKEMCKHLGWSISRARYYTNQQITRKYLIAQNDGRAKRYALAPSARQ